MKVYGVVFAAVLLFSTAALADTTPLQACSAGTLESYIALGSTGCSVGNLGLSKFSYTPSGDLLHTPPASLVNLRVLNGGSPGISFNGRWFGVDSVMGKSQVSFEIKYVATALDPASHLTGMNLAFVFFRNGGAANLSLEAEAPPYSTCYVTSQTNFPDLNRTSQSCALNAQVIPFREDGTIYGTGDILQITNTFDLQPSGVTPEPSSILLLGSGLAAAGFLRRKFFGAAH